MPEQVQFYSSYDLDATSYKYGRITGPFQGNGGLEAAGSTTVTGTTPADSNTPSNPFAGLKAGDGLWLRTAERTVVKRKIATLNSPTSIVISGAAMTFSGIPFKYLPFTIGTGLTNGWHRIAHWAREKTLHILIPTVAAADGVVVNVEVRGQGNFQADPNQVWTKTYLDAAEDAIQINQLGSDLRVGVKGGSGSAGTDDISIFMVGRKELR